MKKFIAAVILSTVTSTLLAQEPVWDANTVVLESQKLADGIFAVIPTGADAMAEKGLPIATTSGFVIGSEGVLVIDSMLNERLYKQLMALIAEQTDRPVRYMVNTSYHGDHSYGNYYLSDDVTIIQHAETKSYIENHFPQDVIFMKQNFGEGRGIENIEPVAADLTIKKGGSVSVNLGDMTVDISDYGFAQTGGDLFVSVPSANTLWTGNPVIASAPALPWLLDGQLVETRDTLQRVYEAHNAETIVVPGHGPVTDIETIKWNIDYLNVIESQVRSALADGLSLEQTIAKVQLPEFQGYALFGWVHPGLNIPAAYNDLK